jgi:hypothetical protein
MAAGNLPNFKQTPVSSGCGRDSAGFINRDKKVTAKGNLGCQAGLLRIRSNAFGKASSDDRTKRGTKSSSPYR